jgi:hypothetical protein
MFARFWMFFVMTRSVFVAAFLAALSFLSLAALVYLLFIPVSSVSIERGKDEITVRRGAFGWGGVKIRDLSSAESFEVHWRSGSFENKRRDIYLKLRGAKKSIPLIYSAARGKPSADELKFLAGLLGLDPARDMTYTFHYEYMLLDGVCEVL